MFGRPVRWVVHPFLFSVFPILFLYSSNAEFFPVKVIYRPLVVALCLTAAALVLLRLAVKDWRKAGLLATLLSIFATSAARIARSIGHLGVWGAVAARTGPRVAFVLTAFGFAVIGFLLLRTRRDLRAPTQVANLMALCLVIMPILSTATGDFGRTDATRYIDGARGDDRAETTAKAPQQKPHIFYIVLDGYGRADNLKEAYGFDNSEFLGFLESRGFRIASKARTNYAFTFLSLASSLNMQYLDDVASHFPGNNKVYFACEDIIAHSRVRRLTSKFGYAFVSFATGCDATEIGDADTYLSDPWQLGEFEQGLVATMLPLSDETRIELERTRVLYPLERLGNLAGSRKPLFVFAHIIAPHPPYVFGRDGGPSRARMYTGTLTGSQLVCPGVMTRPESQRAYIDQMVFVNSRLRQTVDAILSHARVRPIIIIQGDHGPCCFLDQQSIHDTYLQDRMSILSAYYLPDGGNESVHDSMTPVNSFRVVFNRYFGTQFAMLPERSYFIVRSQRRSFIDVTDEIGSPRDRAIYERLRRLDYFDSSAIAGANKGVPAEPGEAGGDSRD